MIGHSGLSSGQLALLLGHGVEFGGIGASKVADVKADLVLDRLGLGLFERTANGLFNFFDAISAHRHGLASSGNGSKPMRWR